MTPNRQVAEVSAGLNAFPRLQIRNLFQTGKLHSFPTEPLRNGKCIVIPILPLAAENPAPGQQPQKTYVIPTRAGIWSWHCVISECIYSGQTALGSFRAWKHLWQLFFVAASLSIGRFFPCRYEHSESTASAQQFTRSFGGRSSAAGVRPALSFCLQAAMAAASGA